MVVAVDTGNRQMKGAHSIFPSGLDTSTTRPGFGEDILFYNGKYYIVSENRLGYKRDKSNGEDFFILTLILIAKELIACGAAEDPNKTIPIELLIGLPPAHYGAENKRFTDYFLNREALDIELDGHKFRIRIVSCDAFVQGYAAAMTVYGQIKGVQDVCVIDIGGFTVDYLMLHKGRADTANSDSLELGVITLYNQLIKRINGEFDLLVKDSMIDAVLMNQQSSLSFPVKTLIREATKEYIVNIVNGLRERGIDLRTSKAVFVGGGSMLLKEYLVNNERVGSDAIVVNDVFANVHGYELLYKVKKQAAQAK